MLLYYICYYSWGYPNKLNLCCIPFACTSYKAFLTSLFEEKYLPSYVILTVQISLSGCLSSWDILQFWFHHFKSAFIDANKTIFFGRWESDFNKLMVKNFASGLTEAKLATEADIADICKIRQMLIKN